MSTPTTRLGLSVYDDTDNPTVKNWRDTINKNAPQSAFEIVDQYATDTDERITVLEEANKLFRVSATESTTNSYLATNADIITLTTGMQIQLSVNVTNTGATLLNINSLGANALQKFSSVGTKIALGANDLIANKIYSFEYQTNTWVLMGGIALSQIITNEEGIDKLLAIGADNTIQISDVSLYGDKIAGEGINIDSNTLDIDANHNIKLKDTGVTIGTYIGITVDAQGRIIGAETPNPASSGNFIFRSDDSVLSWATSAPNSDKLGGNLPANYLPSADGSVTLYKLSRELFGILGEISAGWTLAYGTWVYANANTITVPSGAASIYKIGDKIKITQTTEKYFYIIGVTDTTLTIYAGNDFTLANATITSPYYSRANLPSGFPIWMNYTMNITVSGGTVPTFSSFTSQFRIHNRLVYLWLNATNSSGGTAGAGSATMKMSLPIYPLNYASVPTFVSMGSSSVAQWGYGAMLYSANPRYANDGLMYFYSSSLSRNMLGSDHSATQRGILTGTSDVYIEEYSALVTKYSI